MAEKTILRKVKNSNGIYTCDELDITVDEWKKVLQDKSITNNYKLWLARFYQEDKHTASCKIMGKKFNCSYTEPRDQIKYFGITAQKILNRFEVQGTDGKPTYWVIPMKKGIEIKDLFEWTMRDELVQALEEVGMTNPEDFEENLDIGKIQLLIKRYKRLLDSDLETAFTSEEYKWDIIKWCENKSDVEIYQYLVDEKPNLFDKFSVAQAGKDIVEESKINELLGQLYDENKELNERLSDFKKYMENKADPTKKRILKDERAASVFLTCKYPDKYTFYKDSYYGKLCDFLSVPKKSAGEKYSHFLELISEIEEVIKTDTELLSKMDNLTKNYSRNTKLIAQNMTYVLFDRINILSENQGDTQMVQEDTLVKKYANLLKNTKNLILTGAPGTGKTYLAKQIAKELGCKDDNIGFVQFHPSYDYTDFVEGLRPTDKDGNGNVGFERRDGVFKKFCEKAILPSSVTEDIQKELNENPTIWKVSLERTGDNPTRTDCLKNGYIRLGWSNYGDVADFSNFSGYTEVGGSVVLVAFQSKMKVGDIVLSCYSATEIDAVGIVTGDYEYRPEGGDYPRYRTVKWIVKGIKENIVEKNHGKTLTLASVYKLSVSIKDVFDIVEKYSTNQTLSSDSQEKTSNSPYVFIIDEINRGEVAKIFGELFYCVDPGYRGKDGKINTQYQNLIKENNIFYSGFFIPENVYIIGTMNDIDRSVESMDFAFRRRFTWAEVKASDTVDMLYPSTNENGESTGLESKELAEAKRRMENLNNAISEIEGLNEAYHIGASYFLKLKNYDGDFECLWEYHIKGILQEYLRGNPDGKLDDLKAAYDKREE